MQVSDIFISRPLIKLSLIYYDKQFWQIIAVCAYYSERIKYVDIIVVVINIYALFKYNYLSIAFNIVNPLI